MSNNGSLPKGAASGVCSAADAANARAQEFRCGTHALHARPIRSWRCCRRQFRRQSHASSGSGRLRYSDAEVHGVD